MLRSLLRTVWGVGVFAAGAAVSYRVFLRDRCLSWGATPAEVEREMPGDQLIPRPDILATRAVGIDARPSDVWPWLVQMGSGRGGAYTYDWIENLFGLDMRSADAIVPELQDLEVGAELALGEAGPVLRVEVLEPERALTLRSDDGAWVWSFGLYPENGSTRLVSRNRIQLKGAPAARKLLYGLVMEPGSLAMERKMLLGIKERAERLAAASPG